MSLVKYTGVVILCLFLVSVLARNRMEHLKADSDLFVADLAFRLEETAEPAGIKHVHQKSQVHPSLKNVEPWLTAVGASAAVVDLDGDGFMDIYLCNSDPNSKNFLYRNNHDGTFTDVAAKYGLAEVNRPHGCLRPIFFDFDQDGRKDLFLGTTFCPKLYRQTESGIFSDVSNQAGLGKYCGFSVASNVIDFNGDGFPDLVIAGYFPSVDLQSPTRSNVMHNSIFAANNGGATYLLLNKGNGTFQDSTGSSGIDLHGWVLAVGVYDLNEDGLPDLWFGIDFNKNKVYLNRGQGRFQDISAGLSNELSRSGMGVDFADLDEDGKPFAFISQIFQPQTSVRGNQLFKFKNESELDDQADFRGVLRCGWSWGAKFVDLDNDTRPDLVVGNGFISRDPDKDYWFYLDQIYAANGLRLSEARNWHEMANMSLAGFQKDCIYMNRGDHFEPVTKRTAFSDFSLDGRAVSLIDAENKGSMSLVVTNQGQKTPFFKNTQLNSHHWIGFRLFSRNGHPDVYGARVQITLQDGRTLRQQSYYNNGFTAQSDPRIHFGLGDLHQAEKVLITWPGGRTSEFTNLAGGTYHELREP